MHNTSIHASWIDSAGANLYTNTLNKTTTRYIAPVINRYSPEPIGNFIKNDP